MLYSALFKHKYLFLSFLQGIRNPMLLEKFLGVELSLLFFLLREKATFQSIVKSTI